MTATLTPPQTQLPGKAALARITAGALAVAGAILVLFVLPAEYGIDPTGAGKALGIAGMAAGKQAETQAAAPLPGGDARAAIVQSAPWRSDEMTITLAPHSGREIKARMRKGDALVFRWEAQGGPVKMDMHGDHADPAAGGTQTYWKQLGLTEAQGSFTAGFEGRHGWYWRNKGEVPVIVKLRTAGFYGELFEPKD